MVPVKTYNVKNIEDPRLAPYKTLKTRSPEKDGLFITENVPSVKALLESDLEVVSCVTTAKTLKNFQDKIARSRRSGITFYLMERPDIENLIGFKFHHGIMMAARLPARKPFPEVANELPADHLAVALNGVHDPQNVGLITRNLAAFGADVMVVDEKTHEPYYRKVTRISLGAIFKIKIAYENSLPGFLAKQKSKGTKIIVPSLSRDALEINQTDLRGKVCVVMGNEYAGASEEVLALADETIRIPQMFDKADSLNVACASSIILYQAYLQRRRVP